MGKKMGRPLKGQKPMGQRLEIRVEAGEKAAYDKAAKLAGLERSDWIRATLNEAVTKIDTKVGERGNRTRSADADS